MLLPFGLTKEALVYTAFTVDALNTFFSFPLFATKGKRWVLENLLLGDEKKDPSILEDVNRVSFERLYDLFMVCYEGYFGFTASTLICIYKNPETIPIFSYSLFSLYLYKLVYIWPRYRAACALGPDEKNTDSAMQTKGKTNTILFFFLPCYGGYCALHCMETAWARALLKRA